jgi:PAS domain-containing protein
LERRADQFKVGLALSIILTIAAVAAGYYTREFIQSWLHITLPIYGLFVPIIVLVNVYLGRWFGILSAVFSTLVIEYWMLQQSLLPHQLSASDIATLGLYFLNCLIFIFIVDRSQRKQARVYQLEALQAQREISNKLEAALSSMTDAVFISDEKGAYVDCNEAFATFHKFNGKQEGPKTRAELLALLDIYEPSGELVAHEQLPTQRALRRRTM